MNDDLALSHSIQLAKLVKRIKDLEMLIDSNAQDHDEFHLRLVALEGGEK